MVAIAVAKGPSGSSTKVYRYGVGRRGCQSIHKGTRRTLGKLEGRLGGSVIMKEIIVISGGGGGSGGGVGGRDVDGF